jgi:hypothetical protein
VTLRNRVSVAAAVMVLVFVGAVSSVLYLSYAASLHSRVDATLVDAAEQAATIAQRIKQSGTASQLAPDVSRPVSIGSVEVQLLPDPVAGQPTLFGPLGSRDVAVAEQAQPAYFAERLGGGQQFRVYTAAWLGNPGGWYAPARPRTPMTARCATRPCSWPGSLSRPPASPTARRG